MRAKGQRQIARARDWEGLGGSEGRSGRGVVSMGGRARKPEA